MFAGLKRAARAIFVDDVRVRRDEEGLHIVFENGPAGGESPLARARREADEQRQRQLQQIRDQLAAVFATLPGLRQHLEHLARVEAALVEQGLAFLDSMPLAQLRLALRQFEDAVLNWAPEGLAYLRSRMAMAVRERALREGEATGDISALPVVHEVEAVVAVDDEQAALLAAYGSATAQAGEAR